MIINQKKIDQAIWNYINYTIKGTTGLDGNVYYIFKRMKENTMYHPYSIEISLDPFTVISLEEIQKFKYNNYDIHIEIYDESLLVVISDNTK